ncbi:MAG: hypothetical protein AB1595_00900 [bacterium]
MEMGLNSLIRAGPLILFVGLSVGGLSRASPTPVNTEVSNIAELSYEGGDLSSNPATFTVGQVYGVWLKNKEPASKPVSPEGSVDYEYEARNTGNGTESINLGTDTISANGIWNISLVKGNVIIANPITLGPGEAFSFFLKVSPAPGQKEGASVKVKVIAETLEKDGPMGGGDKVEDITTTFISQPPVLDLSRCVNYPNPFDLTKYDHITIGPLPLGTVVKLYTISGFLVNTLQESNGSVIWDGKNNEGSRVASGIYIWMAESQNEHKVGKLTLIR